MHINEYILPILQEGDNRLHETSGSVAFESYDPELVSRQLIHTMLYNYGCGLAGCQVGYLDRVFAIGETIDDARVFFNPTIIKKDGEKDRYKEGCLSFPSLYLNIWRPREIVVEYQDANGKDHRERLAGFPARVFQHEQDHLDGITFVQHVGKVSLDLARRRQRKYLKSK